MSPFKSMLTSNCQNLCRCPRIPVECLWQPYEDVRLSYRLSEGALAALGLFGSGFPLGIVRVISVVGRGRHRGQGAGAVVARAPGGGILVLVLVADGW